MRQGKMAIQRRLVAPDLRHMDEARIQHILGIRVFEAPVRPQGATITHGTPAAEQARIASALEAKPPA
jgi:hypothetical protein